ncbi:hypothetical protein GL213_02080 [Halogeometricum borinquense]|uniref:Uncharacterized protein n=1 Tax=Halogeometricum borinquense TaxID=60847 RepID=A0A6C0UMK5_9EURY|nr:hypothetical protein G3I44_06070 [Halogeometricum borinquense]QIQ77684.1 hypothetical protein GL213_02080 [Halogeometricum borinquense]
MYLRNFDCLVEYTQFDPSEGVGDGFTDIEGQDISGVCSEVDGVWVAIYPDSEKNTILVQIDGTTWDLYSPDTEVAYNHDYENEKTSFRISDNSNTFTTTYDAWWQDRPDFEPNKWAASREDENADEDIFGYILMLWHRQEKKQHYINNWANEQVD